MVDIFTQNGYNGDQSGYPYKGFYFLTIIKIVPGAINCLFSKLIKIILLYGMTIANQKLYLTIQLA
jgi:hypothetical protein